MKMKGIHPDPLEDLFATLKRRLGQPLFTHRSAAFPAFPRSPSDPCVSYAEQERKKGEVQIGKANTQRAASSSRCIVIMVGVIITAYGAEAFVLANLGSDPVTAFVQGLGKVLGLEFGNAMNVFNIVFFVIILIFNRKTIGIGTVLYTFTLGVFCTMLDPWIRAVIGAEPTMVSRVVLIVTGTIALASALASTSPRNLAAARLTRSTRPWPRS